MQGIISNVFVLYFHFFIELVNVTVYVTAYVQQKGVLKHHLGSFISFLYLAQQVADSVSYRWLENSGALFPSVLLTLFFTNYPSHAYSGGSSSSSLLDGRRLK